MNNNSSNNTKSRQFHIWNWREFSIFNFPYGHSMSIGMMDLRSPSWGIQIPDIRRRIVG